MDKSTHELRLAKWSSIIKECRSSGMTVKSWCETNDIDKNKFFYWQRKVREKIYTSITNPQMQSEPNFVELPAPIESSIGVTSFNADMVLHIGNSTLEISNSTSEELLSMVLKAVSNVK